MGSMLRTRGMHNDDDDDDNIFDIIIILHIFCIALHGEVVSTAL